MPKSNENKPKVCRLKDLTHTQQCEHKSGEHRCVKRTSRVLIVGKKRFMYCSFHREEKLTELSKKHGLLDMKFG
jgi:hypothetical protein